MKQHRSKLMLIGICALVLMSVPTTVWAQDDALSSGDTAWMLTSSVLVLFMTIPGLSLFYADLVRPKNVLSVMMQCFAISRSVVRVRSPALCNPF